MGHLIVAEEAGERLSLDQVLFVPAGRPWFKEDQDVTDAQHRVGMVKIAVAGNARFEVSEIEVRRPGRSYTVDTLLELRKTLGDSLELYNIVGLDALGEIDRWHQPARVLELAQVVGICRPGFEVLDRSPIEAVRKGASEDVVVIDGPLIGISGRDIRERVSKGSPITYLVPGPVEEYIYKAGLYGGAHGGVRG